MLDMTADELAALKEDGGDGAAFRAVLKRALWTDWSFRVQTRTRCVWGKPAADNRSSKFSKSKCQPQLLPSQHLLHALSSSASRSDRSLSLCTITLDLFGSMSTGPFA